MASILNAVGIWKSFDGVDVLKGVDLKVSRGECVFIIGPSGSGKSTLLRCLNRLEEPTSGRIWLEQQEVTGKTANLNRLREQIGMVFQSFNLYPHLNVRDNITLALCKVQKHPKSRANDMAMDALAGVGLREKADAMPAALSGGQQQRVAIARAIALKPKVMLFDEPTSALDPELVGSVIETMRSLKDGGMTMVIVSHEMRFARQAADRIIFMADGVEVVSGTPAEMLDHPPHRRLAEFLSGLG